MSQPKLFVAAGPHVTSKDTTPRIMWTVVATLVPVVAAAGYFFGISALLVTAAACLGAVITEHFVGSKRTLSDGSCAITGILLGLTLPPGMPLWMAFLGGFFGVAFGKLLFGGLGQNPFNPALLGRAFLQAAFPVAITTWPKAGAGNFWDLRGDNFALPLMSPQVPDGSTGATPLGLLKFEGQDTDTAKLFLGTTGGSVGETAAYLILICGLFLAWKGYLQWRIPAAIFLAAGLLSEALHAWNPALPGALFMIGSGGMMLGAFYMATDMVTSPTTQKGAWIFGAGIGVLVVIIRNWGGLPEGMMYSILLMNAMVPFLNRWTRPRVFGVQKKLKEVAP